MTYRIREAQTEDWRELRELRLAALADPIAPVAFLAQEGGAVVFVEDAEADVSAVYVRPAHRGSGSGRVSGHSRPAALRDR